MDILKHHNDPQPTGVRHSGSNNNNSKNSKTKMLILVNACAMLMVALIALKSILEANNKQQHGRRTSDADVASREEEREDGTNEKNSLFWKSLTDTKIEQIENYRSGDALMLNFHPTHHGGTSFCTTIGRNGIHGDPAPSFACMEDTEGVMPDPPLCKDHASESEDPYCRSYREMHRDRVPWWKNETGPFIESIRPYFHMISWEYGSVGSLLKYKRSLDDPDWEHPFLLSVAITRDPLSRMMAGDRIINDKYEGIEDNNLSQKGWWDYAAYDNMDQTDNFFLRMLSGQVRPTRTESQTTHTNHIEEGIPRTTKEMMELFPTELYRTHFEHARSVLGNFTVVLDIACLDEGFEALGNLLHMDLPPADSRKHPPRPSDRERIGHDDVYEYLLAKNRWDIALYEYSKTISLVECDSLADKTTPQMSDKKSIKTGDKANP